VGDARQLWRPPVFNRLITNVDDHLQHIGFFSSGNNLWRLSPALDRNPFPDKHPQYKTWLNKDSGLITSIEPFTGQAIRFELSPPQAQAILEEAIAAARHGRDKATPAEVGLPPREINDFRPAFESATIGRSKRFGLCGYLPRSIARQMLADRAATAGRSQGAAPKGTGRRGG